MGVLKRIGRSRPVRWVACFLAAGYIRFVHATSRWEVVNRQTPETLWSEGKPFILSFWHGRILMMPYCWPGDKRMNMLISRHRDGEINAIAAERLNVGTVRGSGDHGSEFHRKGGVGAFKAMLRVLDDKINMALTADVPKVSRKAGLGIIMLARESGRPILPVAIATSRFKRLNNWDRSVIHLPFGRGVIAGAELIWVPPDADNETMQALRLQLEERLNDVTRRAYGLVGRPDEGFHA